MCQVDPSELSTDAEAVALLAAADAIVCLPYGGVVVDDPLTRQLPRLRHVQLLSAGFSEVTPQITELQQRGITVSNSACSVTPPQIRAQPGAAFDTLCNSVCATAELD